MSLPCYDCRKNTANDSNYYMVLDHVWLSAWPDYPKLVSARRKMPRDERPFYCLCLDCLEKRLGRILNIHDFRLNVPVNYNILQALSDRASRRRQSKTVVDASEASGGQQLAERAPRVCTHAHAGGRCSEGTQKQRPRNPPNPPYPPSLFFQRPNPDFPTGVSMADAYPEVHAAEFRVLVFLEKRKLMGHNVSALYATELADIKDLAGVLKEMVRRKFIEQEIQLLYPCPYMITKEGSEVLAAYRR